MSSIFQQNPTNYFVDSPAGGEIKLIAGKPNFGTEALDSNLCQQIKECGFNAVGATVGYEKISSSLTNCANNGLSLFLFNGSLFDHTEQIITQFSGREGLGGWLMDYSLSYKELTSNESLGAGALSLKEAYKKIIQLETVNENSLEIKHPIYLAFSGDWERDVSHEVIDLPTFIKLYQDTFKPSIWPVAYFPDLTRSDAGIFMQERITMFYKTLQYMAYVSQFTSSPFWSFCRCQGIKGLYNLNGPAPSLNLMRGIVFTALAYGAQGIYYWNYLEDENGYPKYHMGFDGPLNREGKKTATWGMVQTVNSEVKNFNQIFYGCEMIDCRHVRSQTSGNEWLKIMKHPIGPLMKVTSTNSDNSNYLVSHIFNKGKDYLIVIADPFSINITQYNTVTLQFNNYWNVFRVQYNNGLSQQPIQSYSPSFNLYPGDYLIFTWN